MKQLERVARAIVDAIDGDTDEWRMWTIEAQAAIDAMGPEWRPIETAPHGTDVILYCPYRNETNQERMEFGKATRGVHGLGKSTVSAHPWATHWMPLPEPPK